MPNIFVNKKIYLEDAGLFFHEKKLDENRSDLIEASRVPLYEKAAVYDLQVLTEHLKYVCEVNNFDDITSSVARCVEYGLKPELEFLLSNLNDLIKKCICKDHVTQPDYRLLLRKCNLPCYLIAKNSRFIDPELEKRFSCLQNKLRRKSVKISYAGPYPDEYNTDKLCEPFMGPGNRYWGYRQTLYFIRWNRKLRLEIARHASTDWWGDCRYQAYIDHLEHGEDPFKNED